MSATSDNLTSRTALRRASAWMLAVMVLVLLLGSLTSAWRLSQGDDLKSSVKSSTVFQFRHLRQGTGLDSWGPMIAAWLRQHRNPGGATYADSLELDNCKYQYPPSSLLILEVLPAPTLPVPQFFCSRDADGWSALETGAWAPKVWIDRAALLAVLSTFLVSGLIVLRVLERREAGPGSSGVSWSTRFGLMAATFGAGLVFYPLIWGYELGQVQVFLNLFVSLAFLAMLQGRAALAGVLIGLCCVYKPQYALLLAWALLRREWRFGAGLLAVVAATTALAVGMYGWAVHVEYLQFLRGLAKVGEVFWANQSVNGLLNRWYETANPVEWADWGFASSAPMVIDRTQPYFAWDAAGFPSYHPVVHAGTVLSSALILGLGFLLRWGQGGVRLAVRPVPSMGSASTDAGRALDLAVVLMASTMASPIAWQHHYGPFFAAFALVLALRVRALEPTRRPAHDPVLWVLGLAFALMAYGFLRVDLVFANPVRGLLGSHLWLGALVLFGLSLRQTDLDAPHALPGARP